MVYNQSSQSYAGNLVNNMNRIPRILLFTLSLIAITSIFVQAESDLDILKKLMPGPLVKAEVKSNIDPASQGKPPFASDNWIFNCSGVEREIHYNRFLNQKPEFDGTYPSLTPSDMGVGFGGGPFSYWYYNGAIRVLIDGVDVMAAKRADVVEYRSGSRGDLRLVWNLGDGGRLALYFVVPSDGRAIYTAIEPYLPNKPKAKIQVTLVCYPAGFGPTYGAPSIRSVTTQHSRVIVPRGFKGSDKNPFPTLTISPKDDYIFYADDYDGTGSLFLALPPSDWSGGKVSASNYGQATTLEMRSDTKMARLGFYASGIQNASAEAYFLQILPQELKILSNIKFWSLGQ